MAVVNISWTPPPLDWLSYSDCSAVATWYRGALLDGYDSPLATILNYLNSSLPNNLSTYPNDAQLIGWHLGERTSDQVVQWMVAGWNTCTSQNGDASVEFCANYGSAGHSDLAGPGTFIAYHLEAALATIYAIVILFDHIRRLPPKKEPARQEDPAPKKDNAGARVLHAFRESSIEFLDAAVLFSIGLQIASIVQSAQFLRTSGRELTDYAVLVSMMASFFSVFCAALLHCATFSPRRQKQRIAGWLILLGLVTTNLALIARLGSLRYDLRDQNSAWEARCYRPPPFNPYALGNSMTGIFFVTLAWICFSIRLKDYRWAVGTLLRLAFALTCLVTMWTLLGFITAWKTDISQAASGENNEDQEWTFGQILALAMWAPVFKSWGFIAIFGPERP
ncbi:hypothetical protein DL770_001674 [Monosporascus sp. CRB-9-2]|nr:hypothetical protein DL770_001674 [Monosporascus sp. CRB-9-2]